MISGRKGGAESFSCGLIRTSILRWSSSVLFLYDEFFKELSESASRFATAICVQTTNGEQCDGFDPRHCPVLVDASHNAYGDKGFSDCRTKEEAKLAELKKRTFLIGTKSVDSAKHEGDVASLQISLDELCYFGEASRRGRGRHRRRSHRGGSFA